MTILKLTEKETQIAQMIGKRYSTDEIAEELGLKRSTVFVKLSMIYMKLGLRHRHDLEKLYSTGGDAETFVPDLFSDMEWQIIHYVCVDRYGIREIMAEMGYVKRKSLEQHLRQIYAKLDDVHSMFDLCYWYNNRGTPDE